MTLYDTTLVDGTDLRDLGCLTVPYEAPYVASPERGDLDAYDGIDGVQDFDLPLDAGLYAVRFALVQPKIDGTWHDINDKFRALRSACKPGRKITLGRRMGFSTGDEEHTASARLLDIVPTRPDPAVMICLVEFKLLDGCFFGPSVSVAASAAPAPTVKGDTRTHRVTAVLSAGAVNPLVTNTTNGYFFSYTGTVPSGGISVDCYTRRATAITGGADVSTNLRWGKTHPMRLESGANALTCSSGTVALTYLPTYF